MDLSYILDHVEKPARYTGGEWNSVIKKKDDVFIRFAFCFPDIYEIGMSHLGMKILYHLLNDMEDIWCERVFAPWTDMEELMRENGIPLFGLESGDPIRDFDFVGFTLQYEMSYTNVLNMLDLAGIPLLAKDRGEDMPLVIGGGPTCCNPEPLADFFDLFVIGDGEEAIIDIMEEYRKWKKGGESRRKKDFLEAVSSIRGVYVPSFYNVDYNLDGTVKSINPASEKYPAKIRRRVILDMDKAYYPEKMVVPFLDIVHDRIMLELFRGCIRGCRFCQAGYIYRPVRWRSVDKLLEKAEKLVKSTGYEEISLSSLSTSDYPYLNKLTMKLLDKLEDKKVSLSLPSLRVDSFTLELLDKTTKVRKSGLTFAPEAGTQRLRDVINKGISEEDILKSAFLAFNNGYNRIKLYFMLGLPTETMEDVAGIAELARKIAIKYYEIPKNKRPRNLLISMSTSTFVSKPFTAFQWASQDSMESILEKQAYLKKLLPREVKYSWHESKLSILEGVFSRGDRRLSRVLLKAWEKGCKFDSWAEHFKFDRWMEAFEECGLDPSFYNSRERAYEEIFPWEHIDMGVSKKFLLNEYKKALRGETTPNCMENCSYCGIMAYKGGICLDHIPAEIQ